MAKQRVSTRGRSLHVLVVDDDAAALDLTRERLENEGYQVTSQHVVSHLETLIRLLRPDVVLLDVLMPHLTADALGRLLRTQSGRCSPPVILHSSVPAGTLRHVADISGALGVVRRTDDDAEFFFAFNALIDRMVTAPSVSGYRHTDVPAASGTHRIDGEADGATELDAAPDWASGTSSGRR